jgi:hypothetical protein
MKILLRPRGRNFIFTFTRPWKQTGTLWAMEPIPCAGTESSATLPLLCNRKDWAAYAPRYDGFSLGGMGNRLIEIAGLARGVRGVALAFRSLERDVLYPRLN